MTQALYAISYINASDVARVLSRLQIPSPVVALDLDVVCSEVASAVRKSRILHQMHADYAQAETFPSTLQQAPRPSLSIVLPAKNEAAGLRSFLTKLKSLYPHAEVIVVDDGSTDETASVARESGVTVLSSPYSMGNGAAIKRGARVATGEVVVFMDADGQHDPVLIQRLLTRLGEGFDMVVGARDRSGQANLSRGLANGLYNRVASWMTGFDVKDLTSGFRAVRANKFREFLHLLPNGFSYPTTSTMAFFRSGYAVAYEPIPVAARIGHSHIKPLKDGLRFLLIIFKIATLYSPLKIFAPTAATFFALGCGYYAYTYVTENRFTNMSALLFSASVIIFLIGLVSEQITALTYTRPRD